jgi:osmoprotectant transport system substrate-binding protein
MKRRVRLAFAIMAGLAIVAAGCGDSSSSSTTTTAGGTATTAGGDKPAIVIGAQDFGESAILAEIYKQALVNAGIDASVKSLGANAFRDVELEAFSQGTINFAPEYAASMLEFLNDKKGEATSDATETVSKLQPYLDAKGLVALEPTEAVDTNAFVMTKEESDADGITSLSDLAAKGTSLKIGAPADCLTNPFCVPGIKTVYGADLSNNVTQLEPGAIADALEAGSIDVALLFSTSGIIADKGWVLLADDKHMLAADNVVPVLTTDVSDAYGDTLTAVTDAIKAKLTTAGLTGLDKRYDIDKEDADAIATAWLTENGLI